MSQARKPPTPPMSMDMYVAHALVDCIESAEGLPHLLLQTAGIADQLPASLASQNPLILNIGRSACAERCFHDQSVSFKARFNGAPYHLTIPYTNILVIFDKISGEARPLAASQHPLKINLKDPTQPLLVQMIPQETVDHMLTPPPEAATPAPVKPVCTTPPDGSSNVRQLFPRK
jgi:stringent starvation protein B